MQLSPRSPLLLSTLLSSFLFLGACGGGGGSSSGNPSSASASSSSQTSSEASSSSDSSSSSSSEALSLHTLADFPIGVAVSAANEPSSIMQDDEAGVAQRAIIEAHFDQLTAGNIMKMSYLHPAQDTYFFDDADALLDYADDNGISLHAHTLVWHSDYQVPDWMKNFEGDATAWLAMYKEHVETIAGHFAGRVPSWDVVNEAFNEDGTYRNSLFNQKLGTAYIETAFASARQADPQADLYYNDFNISNGGDKFQAMINMVDDFIARDIPIDGVGFQMHVFMDWPSIDAIKSSFAAVAERGLKVKITELDIPINNPYSAGYNYPDNYEATFTDELAAAQKKRYCDIVTAYLDAVPADLRGGLTVWGIRDSDSWLISTLFDNNHEDWPLLFDNNFDPKPALYGVADGLTNQPCL